jgi:DNA-binding transcriptional MocR family regulator
MNDELATAQRDYETLKSLGLALDITRGKPASDQLDLSAELLRLPGDVTRTADGADARNYGGLLGLLELREIFADALQVPAEQLVAMGNSSLALMYDTLATALLFGVPGGTGRWLDEGPISMLCPVPGYDRHFALSETLGFTLIPVPMDDDGPDMNRVEELVAADVSIKAIWCVPKYSNPSGACYSDDVVRRLAAMPTAAPDFRVVWDNAYAVHHLTNESVEIADILALSRDAGNPDRPLIFGSTSKITFAGAGVAFFGASKANVDWFIGAQSKRTIGPDKVNQLAHAMFLKSSDGLAQHMEAHRALLAPKFTAVQRILAEQLGGTGLATWSTPRGGYFVLLEVPEGCARAVVAAAREAGIVLTPAGSTHPHMHDPNDSVIRIAPTFVMLADLEKAISGLATCVKLVGYQKQAAN